MAEPTTQRSRIAMNSLLIVLSLLLSVLVAEAGVRLMYPWLANYNLEMWRYFAIFKELHPHENLPFTMKPNREASLYGVHVATNALGFRNPEISAEKPDGVHRIVVLGDSQTFGWGVPEEDTIPRALEARLHAEDPDYEVINLGVGNYNSIMEVELFKREGLRLAPDTVILVYFVNDAEAIPRIAPWRFHVTRFSYLYAFLWDRYVALRARVDSEFTWKAYYQSLYQESNPHLAMNREALLELFALCEEHGITLMIASYPDLHVLEEYPLPEATAYIAGLARDHNVPFVDLLPHFQQYEAESLWVSSEDPHGNATATRSAAAALHPLLLEERAP
ncbi:MAG: SGNH/GDSL hydrolase family protein [Candidatus Hydrogenedentota bacterium]